MRCSTLFIALFTVTNLFANQVIDHPESEDLLTSEESNAHLEDISPKEIPVYNPPAIAANHKPETKTETKPDPKNKNAMAAQSELDGAPWLTGPLLTPSGHTIPAGHFNLEPYLFYNNNVGYYQNHWHIHMFGEPVGNVNLQLLNQIGLASRLDFSFNPQFFYNFDKGQHSWRFGDLSAAMAFQLLTDKLGTPIPAIKVEVVEVFPTGQYQNLQSHKNGVDASGGGTFGTEGKIVLSKLWYYGHHHYFAYRMSVGFMGFSPVKVLGANTYGGDANTNGTVYPGWAQNTFAGIEYTLNRHWALALDIASQYTAKTKFRGTAGGAPVGNPNAAYVLSLAPAIEYNVNENNGFILGVWFSAAGNNTFDFINGILAYNIYI